jgi:hypothetical protein
MFWLFVAAQAAKMYGNYQANQDQAMAEGQNAEYYFNQETQILKNLQRERGTFDRKARGIQGEQMIHMGGHGSTIGYDAILKLAFEKSHMDAESHAMQLNGEFKAKLAHMKGEQAASSAASLRDPMRLLTSGLSMATSFAGNVDTGGSAEDTGSA